MSRAIVAIAGGLGLLAGVAPVRADTNATPIAVPLLGASGPAAPYGSSITVHAVGGPAQTGGISVWLHRVTHPSPKDLAVLLVHGNEKYLLMSNAGGDNPLLGTSLWFRPAAAPLGFNVPLGSGYGEMQQLEASNYGAEPVFPAPAPPGPYTHGLPGAGRLIEGTWTLFVIDTNPENRGVIAGGWSISYDTTFRIGMGLPPVPIPGNATLGIGPAATYPITFDLSQVRAEARPFGVTLVLRLRHTQPDDLRIVLQSPDGTAVAVMANAGGTTDIPEGTLLTFQEGGADLPDEGPIVTGVYHPGAVFGDPTIPAPGPPAPYFTSFYNWINTPVRGIWKLWVYDDTLFDTGVLSDATLVIRTEPDPAPVITTPTLPHTSTQPFLHVEGYASQFESATWRATATSGGTVYAGAFAIDPVTQVFSGDIPLQRGNNAIVYRVGNTGDLPDPHTFAVRVDEFTYSFAEGSTGAFFDMDLTLANTQPFDAPLRIEFLPEGGAPVPYTTTVDAFAPLQLPVDAIVPSAALSTVVHSTDAIPLAAERTMIWDATGYGGHGGTSTAPATRWLFAEGSQGYFNTFVLLANDNAAAASVTMKFLLEGGGVITHPVIVAPKSRKTIFTGDIPALVNQSFGIDLTSTLPVIAERAMYLPGTRLFEGGHESAGVNAASTRWFLAEGATGPFFECFVLLSNPANTPAHVTLTYLLPNGDTIPQSITVPGNARQTINVETVDPRLANAAVSTTVQSDVGIVVERTMYWPDISVGWHEAHNSFGVTDAALRWGVADGRIGGPRAYQTYILLANPNPYPAEVEVSFLKSTGVAATRSYTLPAHSRQNIWANTDVRELGEGVFSADVRVLNYQPIVVEKALYWNSGTEVFAGGTNVTATPLPPP